MSLLAIQTSIKLKESATRAMIDAFASAYAAKFGNANIVRHDFAAKPLPHIPPELMAVQFGAPPTPESAQATIVADNLINELEKASIIAIGAPMYNFTIPSSLKAWVDHIVRLGRTFAYVDGAPKGLLPPGKKVFVMTASGGRYSDGPLKQIDFVEPYLRFVLSFVGLNDVQFVRAEEQAFPSGAEARKTAIDLAKSAAAAL